LGDAGRWYPTLTRLPSGVILITSGYEQVSPYPTPSGTIETYDPVSGARTVVTTSAPPQIVNRDYTHVFVLPYTTGKNDILMFGEQSLPIETSTSNLSALTVIQEGRPGYKGVGTNWGTSSTMLPILTTNGAWGYNNGSVLQASGNMGTPYEHNAAVFDPVAGKWLGSFDLVVPRHHPDAVDLPDGRILLINGHDMGGDTRVEQAEYIDPSNHFAVSLGTGNEGLVRGYHSVALLLPDGRVLVGGGRDQDTDTTVEKPSYQYYYPDYMTKPRPAITSAPSSLAYGALFGITTSGPKPSSAVLVGLGAQTHSFDEDQRYIQLPVGSVSTNASGQSLVIAASPANSHVAPPGYYMLFVLDANRVPSVATIVHIG
jgi:galactose oxidase